MLTYDKKLKKAKDNRVKGDIKRLNEMYYVPISSTYAVLNGVYKNDFIVGCLLLVQEDLKNK